MTNNQQQIVKRENKLATLFGRDDVKAKFLEVFNDKNKSAAFVTSVLSSVTANDNLKKAAEESPMSIFNSALIAATLDLPINPSLGYAYIVPFGQKQQDGTYKQVAQFQIGWKGFVQLAQRTGQYKAINVTAIYEGQLIGENPLTGEYEFDWKGKASQKVVGYAAYFKLQTGFEKILFMSVEEAEFHGKKYSKTYDNAGGLWKKDFDGMAKKTVLKQLLTKWGPMSIQMQKAATFDQSVVAESEDNGDLIPSYDDNPNTGAELVPDGMVTQSKGEVATAAVVDKLKNLTPSSSTLPPIKLD
jgi:recombination protein RecT